MLYKYQQDNFFKSKIDFKMEKFASSSTYKRRKFVNKDDGQEEYMVSSTNLTYDTLG